MENDDFVAWIRDAAIPIETLDWERFDPASLARFDAALADRRIVLVGEPDHYISEKLDCRLVLLRYLVERGFRWIAAERGFSDGYRIDRYLESGDAGELDRVGALGYTGAQRPGRDDHADPFPARWPAEWIACFRAEERWFYEEIRRLGKKLDSADRLHFFGFDVEMMPGGGYADVEAILRDGDPACAPLWRRLQRIDGESYRAEADRLEAALELVERPSDALAAALGERLGFVRESLIALRDSFRIRGELERRLTQGFDPARYEQMRDARELGMGRRMDWLLEELAPDAKVVLFGHNDHFAKDRETLWLRRVGKPKVSPKRILGDYLERRYPGEVLSIWLLFDHGRHYPHPADPKPTLDVQSDPERIESLLAEAGPAYLLHLCDDDPRSARLDEPIDHWTGGAAHSCVLRNQADAVFFLREVQPPRWRR